MSIVEKLHFVHQDILSPHVLIYWLHVFDF